MAGILVDSTSTTAGVTAIAIEWHHHQVGDSGCFLHGEQTAESCSLSGHKLHKQ